MQKFLRRLDEIASVNHENRLGAQLERLAFVFLVLMVVAAPHSIAATQTAWILGMLAWIIRFFLKPRPPFVRTPLDVALWAFFVWSALTCAFSYAPDISVNQLRGAALFLIFHFVVNNARTRRAVYFLVFALIFSCMVIVFLTPIERIIGRGVEIHGLKTESPLAKGAIYEGDTLLEVNRKKIRTPEDLVAEIERNETTKVRFYRPDFYFAADVRRENLLPGATALEKLGVESWKKSRNWRSTGFYGHWTTYAEVLQLIASLVFGLLIALIAGTGFFNTKARGTQSEAERDLPGLTDKKTFSVFRFPFSVILLLFLCLGGMMFALLLTATRASQAAFLLSAFVIVLLGGNRRMILALAAIVLPLVVGGLIFLQQSRNVGFIDEKDDSTRWRQTVYREGFDLWTQSPRNFLVGVGMDSIKRYAGEWRLFDDGRLPMGHFHSTPLQLVVERGLPALLIWLWILWLYAKILRRGLVEVQSPKSEVRSRKSDAYDETSNSAFRIPHSAIEKGIFLGCFGGLVGFFTSGLVHYNLGDQEVAMIFFLLMGLINAKCKMQNAKY
ncbi:MAG: O-antigen ligase family protein [Acidobacteriota bacterium]|nr:O-antigen ligase family protein [Acidobacteriota bacterium]